MADRIRVGIVGIGWGTLVQLPAFRAVPDFEVVALCSRTPAKVEATARQHGVPAFYTDYRELAASKDIDMVSVVVPPQLHHDVAMAAIRAGKHVLCEKPLALNQVLAREMYEAAKAAGIANAVTHQLRWLPERLALKELIVDQQYLGRPYYIQVTDHMAVWHPTRHTQNEWMYHLDEGGGYLYGLIVHDIDLLRLLFGEIAAVSAQVVTTEKTRAAPDGRQIEIDADDTSIINLRFASGAPGVIASSVVAVHAPRMRLEAYGRDGAVTYGTGATFGGDIKAGRPDEADLQPVAPSPREPRTDLSPVMFDKTGRRRRSGEAIRALTLMLEDFAAAIRGGHEFHPSLWDGWRNAQVIDAARASSMGAGWVQIPG